MSNSRTFTIEEKNDAMEFAYAMGLHRPQMAEQTETAMDFARAMGLRIPAEKPLKRRSRRVLAGIRFA